MKTNQLPAAALLDLGDDLHKLVNELIEKYEVGNGAPINQNAADQIVALAFPPDDKDADANKDKAEVLRGHLYAVVKRAGAPTSDKAREILEAAEAVKAQNAATGLETREIILAREWAMLILRSQRSFTPDEYMRWQNSRCNKSDQIAMLPPAAQARVFAEAAAIVERGDAAP